MKLLLAGVAGLQSRLWLLKTLLSCDGKKAITQGTANWIMGWLSLLYIRHQGTCSWRAFRLPLEMELSDTQHGTNCSSSIAKDPAKINAGVKTSFLFSLQFLEVLATPRNPFWWRIPPRMSCKENQLLDTETVKKEWGSSGFEATRSSITFVLQSLQVGMKLLPFPYLFKGINDIFCPVYLERANNWKRIDLLK